MAKAVEGPASLWPGEQTACGRPCGSGVAGTAATFFFFVYQRTIHVLDSVFKSVLQAAVWLELNPLMFYSEQK